MHSHVTGYPSLSSSTVAFRSGARQPTIRQTASRVSTHFHARWSILLGEGFDLIEIRILAGLLALCLTAGCKAQTNLPAPSQSADKTSPDAALNRRIEVMVRSQFSVPQDYVVTIGERKRSQIAGYDTLPISLSRGEKKTQVDFLISSDSKTLARLETFDLLKDPVFSIDVAGRPVRGNPAAKVTVINFDDLECPFCARMHRSLFPDTIARYKDKVRFIYKDDPLVDMHPWAMHAAVDANCLAAEDPEVYWTYVDYLHGHGQEITGPDRDKAKSFAALDRVARQEATLAKLDAVKLDACLAKQDETQVRASAHEAEALKIEGTPAVFVDGERVDGAVPEEQLWLVIDRALRAAGVEPPPAGSAAPAAAAPSAGAGK
jgi:protein-disulfide isomerase